MTSGHRPGGWQRWLLPVSVWLTVAVASGAMAADVCPPADDGVSLERYSRLDVLDGQVPESAPLTRATLGIGGERMAVAVVTEAARARLAGDWPPLRREARLMLVALESGAVLWELLAAEVAASGARHASDPRLSAALGVSAPLVGADGLLRRLYAGDSLGRVWRVDLPPLERAEDAATHWQLDLLAALAPPLAEGSVRFRLPPDLVRSVDSGGVPFDGLVLASEGASVEAPPGAGNGTFFLRDYAVGPRRAVAPALPVITRADLALVTDMPEAVAGTGAGWFAAFQSPAEVAQHRPHTDGGRVFLMTAAVPDACDEPAPALTYVFNVVDGRPLADTRPGTVAGVGWMGGARLEGREIVLPGRGIALPALSGEGEERYRRRFRAAGVGVSIRYWRNLLLDAD